MSARPTLSTILFEVTQRCNHACLHCYNPWSHPAGPRPRDDNDALDVRPLLFRLFSQVECHHVTLTGGEPLLRRDLPVLVSFLRAHHKEVALISNGRLLSDRAAADLLGRGVGLFELPLLSWRREMHDRLSGSPGAFDAVLRAMTSIRRHEGRTVAVIVATRINLADLYDTIQLACALGVDGVMLNRFNPGGRGAAHLDELLPTVAAMKAGLDAAEAAARDFHLSVSCSIPIQPCLIDTSGYRHLSFGFCAAGSDDAYYALDCQGNVRPCNHTPTVLGNVWEQDFASLIASPLLGEFVAATPEFCTACELRSKCQGGCKAAAQVCYGSLNAPEPFLACNRECAFCRAPGRE